MMCDCQSYNRPAVTGGTIPRALPYREHFPHSSHETVCVDDCIADAVEALWKSGIETVHSCCSHNGQFFPYPSVGVRDPAKVPQAAEILRAFRPEWRLFVDTRAKAPALVQGER